MKCKHCGNEIPEGAGVCLSCNSLVDNFDEIVQENSAQNGIFRCEKCGYVGEPICDKVLRPRDWIIFLLTCWSGFGLVYILVTYFTRKNPAKRNLVCPACNKVMLKTSENGALLGQNSVEKTKNVATALANDPNVRRQLKNLGRSVQDFSKSFDP